ncbi:uncharacterized protein SEPMUDRAFT_114756 [Sphaerulina musiva SO2202]|uniref:Uncharacterized protein n=1 Tax=Sphaerulina musiva (strain SO2202) TaxID=692275 RepID=M3CPK4_SPHMS|nr:uncharacterized protein SEPMUDRAFT_114756 [Sphaerulina musiva SO2202]EMF15673.1 hypothetical protein SEPMUDRAFT_114756 [Sphaerulina musiva SO2202]
MAITSITPSDALWLVQTTQQYGPSWEHTCRGYKVLDNIINPGQLALFEHFMSSSLDTPTFLPRMTYAILDLS